MKNGLIIDNTSQSWWLNDRLHREGAPAYIDYNIKSWWLNGKRHRADGPAIEDRAGSKSWFYKGEHIVCETQEKFERLIKLKAFW